MRGYQTSKTILLYLVCAVIFSACGSNEREPEKTIGNLLREKPRIVCDTAAVDVPPVKKNSVTLDVWLETTSLEWFLDKRQSAWREAKAFSKKIVPVDSNKLLQCLAPERKELFLYIPHRFYKKDKYGNEYFEFYIVNNTEDSVPVPMIDAVVNHISSSARLTGKDSTGNWLSFQQTTKFVECGNSFHTFLLPPHTAFEAGMECDFINLGAAPVDYRIELDLNGKKIISNTIGIHLMPEQLPFLGKPF